MASLSADGLAGFEYDSQGLRNPYSPRISWPIPFPTDQTQPQSRTPQQQSANSTTKRSASPHHATDQIYDQAVVPNHGLSSHHPSLPQNYNAQPMSPIQDYRPRSQGQYQAFDQSLLQAQAIGAQLPAQSNAYGQSMNQPQSAFQPQAHAGLSSLQTDWRLPQQASTQEQFPLTTDFSQDYMPDGYNMPYTSAEDFVTGRQTQYDASFAGSYLPLNTQVDVPFSFQGLSNDLAYPSANSFQDPTGQLHPNSPTDSTLDARSLSSSDNGWVNVDYGSYQDTQAGAIFNPGQTLHGRTFSDSSYSDAERQQNRLSWDGFMNVPQHAIGSPDSDSAGEAYLSAGRSSHQHTSPSIKQESEHSSPVLTKATTKPISIKASTSPQRSPISSTSGRSSPPSGRKQPRKNSNKASKPTIRKQAPAPKGEVAEKKVGRRKGPLRPDQRRQACEIRKLGACLRCKFLKKTCDAGEPCHGCCPSHQRQWQVPCTRMDIKDLGYFMADWDTHFHQHVTTGFTIANIAGQGSGERTLYVTHGYGGHLLPIRARDVRVRKNDCFGLDWVEEFHGLSFEHSVKTAELSSGADGISTTLLSAYLDKHIDIGFEQFVDEYFEGTPFFSEMLKTAHRFWTREKTPVIRKALKMMLAYNLIYHITMVEGIPEEEDFPGKITDQDTKFFGKTVAPGMINFEVRVAMSAMWRDLQKEVLEDLSQLYRGVYSKDKLMNWPVIFMVITILLGVWEEMQFDYNFRYPERALVNGFCDEMEGKPVQVIVGLFSAMSQRFPAFQEWDTRKHHHAFNSNGAVCDALTEVRQHVTRHDQYLRSRQNTAFDRDDFDSLSSKFTSQLVIRSTA